MDPNANLSAMRTIAQALVDMDPDTAPASVIAMNAARLAELALAMDEWIRGGGFLPDAWQQASKG